MFWQYEMKFGIKLTDILYTCAWTCYVNEYCSYIVIVYYNSLSNLLFALFSLSRGLLKRAVWPLLLMADTGENCAPLWMSSTRLGYV